MKRSISCWVAGVIEGMSFTILLKLFAVYYMKQNFSPVLCDTLFGNIQDNTVSATVLVHWFQNKQKLWSIQAA